MSNCRLRHIGSRETQINSLSLPTKLHSVFEQALKAISTLPEGCRPELFARLDAVRRISHNFGYGVGGDMDDLLAEYGITRP